MCGKFTNLASWREVVAFSQPLTQQCGEGGSVDGGNSEVVSYRVGGPLPVIIWDALPSPNLGASIMDCLQNCIEPAQQPLPTPPITGQFLSRFSF